MSKHHRGNGQGSIFQLQPSGPWYISWHDHTGRRRRQSTRTTDKGDIAADPREETRRGSAYVAKASLIRVKNRSSPKRRRPINEHLADFRAKMEAQQRDDDHIRRTIDMIREVCTAARFDKPIDITADGVNRAMADLKGLGRSARTIQKRIVACKAFTRWLADHAKLAHDPLRTVKRPSVKKDRRKKRRMLLPAEWPYLYSATLSGAPHDGMTPIERAVLYATAIQTGLRSAELRSLTRAHLVLAGDAPFVRAKGHDTKNGADAKQFIDPGLAAELRQIAATKTPTASVFNMPDEFHVAAMLRADLAAAREQWLDEVKHDPKARAKRAESDFLAPKNEYGEVLDFHALRHTTGAWLALQGQPINLIKETMRHSTITLTVDTYGHLLPDQRSDAISGMSEMMTAKLPLAATGTDGATAGAPAMRKNGPPRASVCEAVRDDGKTAAQGEERKPLRIADVCETVREDATGRGGIRTHTPVAGEGILSPQCLPFHHAAKL